MIRLSNTDRCHTQQHRTSACRAPLRSGMALALFALLALFAPGLHAACSTFLGQATLNEIFNGSGTGGGRFMEVKLLDTTIPATTYANWRISICYVSGGAQSCTSIALGSEATGPYVVTGNALSTDYYYSSQNTAMDFALLDGSGAYIDYFSINGYSRGGVSACAFPYDTSITLAQNPFNISRVPDGTGDWSYQPGNSGLVTEASSNDGGGNGTLHHLRLLHDGQGLTCQAEPVTVHACADAGSDATCTAFTDGVAGTVTAGSHSLAFSIPAGQSSTQVSIPQTTAATLALGTSVAGYDDGLTRCYVGTTQQCQLTFVDTGLLFSPNPYQQTLPHQVSGVASTIYLAAVRTDDNTGTCGPALSGSQPVGLAYECLNPSLCHAQSMLLLNGASIVRNNAGAALSYSSINLDFNASGIAELGFDYRDVGSIALHARLTLSEPATTLIGRSNDLVVRPHDLVLNIPDNPAAANHLGDVFRVAGDDFPMILTAMNALNQPTPSFGRETIPQLPGLTTTLVAPVGGVTPAQAGNFGSFGLDCEGNPGQAGAACGQFHWPEVGIISLRASVSDYLGTGEVLGTASGNIGRFIPAHFDLTPLLQAAACEGGAAPFSYYGQDGLETEFRIEAHNRAGAVTQNYRDNFAKLALNDWAVYGFTGEGLPDGLSLASTETAPTGSWQNGVAEVLAQHRVSRSATPVAPATLRILAAPKDSDGVTTDPAQAVHDSDFLLRHGRLRLQNAHGSELLPLQIPLQLEYLHADGVFVANTDDACTVIDLATQLQLRGSGEWLAADQPVLLAGGSGSTSASLGAWENGRAQLTLSAPGVGNTGYVDLRSLISANQAWLSHPWQCDTSAPNEACARATFGIFEGSPRQIFLRERY